MIIAAEMLRNRPTRNGPTAPPRPRKDSPSHAQQPGHHAPGPPRTPTGGASGLGRRLAQNPGAGGCYLVGHPQYYRKFGFANVDGLVLEGVPAEVCFALSFEGRFPSGRVTFHEGFGADGSGGCA
ncbi:MAG: hypothetical protein IPH48_17230 [bacterium]|nr:hypothetical protein [bacterium]